MNDLLAPERLLIEGQDDLVGDHIVDEIGARGAGEYKIAHLNGRRPMRENAETSMLGVALKINGDVDLKLA